MLFGLTRDQNVIAVRWQQKVLDQPAAHGFFSYSDIIASVLLSLALLLNGVIGLVPSLTNREAVAISLGSQY